MSFSDKTFLSLLRYAVNKDYDENIEFRGIDWNELRTLANSQGVSALLIDGLQNYLSKHPTPFDSENATDKLKRMQWLGQVVAYERMYTIHENAMAALAHLYAEKGIRMMVLKGYGLSLDWPVPNHRPMGDLDIYNFGKWHEADAWVKESCSIKIDVDHEHHTIFTYERVPIENHYDFINTKAHRDAPAIEKYLKRLADRNCQEIEVRGEKIYLPSADFNTIFLMRHMGQHFAGEHLNLRQVLDWGFFVNAHSEEVDWMSMVTFLKEIGLYTFFNQINAICVDHLGFSASVFPYVKRSKDLENRIFADILHPEFEEEKPSKGVLSILAFKFRRWWHNRWKHPLVYKEWLLPMFLTLLWSHLRRYKTIKD